MCYDQKRKFYHKKILRLELLFILFLLATIISCEDSSTEPETAFIDNSNEYDNTIIVSTPEVFELFNISISLTDFGLQDAYYVEKNSEYYNDVQSQFSEYKTHSFIESINEFSNQGFTESNTEIANYNNVKVASFFFELDNDSLKIMPEAYSQLPDSLHYLIQQFSIAANQFIKQSDFITFYNNHKSVYENTASKFKAAIPAMSMRNWLETQFSRTYPLYLILISPLTGGSHFTYAFDENAICMVVSGPDVNISAKTEEGRYSLYLFTEIDHNYVNPVSYEYLDKVNSAFADIDKWNNQEAYRTPYDTFNEYMTWAVVFSIYTYERYTEVEFNSIEEIAINIMENRRFVKFSDFNSKLLELYKTGNGTKVESLFPEILT